MEVSNDEMVAALVKWSLFEEDNEQYKDWYFYWQSIVSLALGYGYLNLIEELTPKGYEQIELAYNELIALGYDPTVEDVEDEE